MSVVMLLFFFKQKTAYEMRISDWSSDVCSSDLTANSGQAKQAQILDSTAADSANVLASNIMAGLTPANARWFALDAGNETPEEKAWLDDSAQLLWENIHLGNFDAEGFESALDMVVAGQFAMYIDEDQRSEEHTSELQSLMRNSYAVLCFKK